MSNMNFEIVKNAILDGLSCPICGSKSEHRPDGSEYGDTTEWIEKWTCSECKEEFSFIYELKYVSIDSKTYD